MAIFQIVHKQRWLLQEIRNVFYYETTVGDPATSEWQDIVDEIRGDWLARLAPANSVDWNFYGIDYRKVDVPGLLSFEALPTLGILAGSHAGDDSATQVACLVSVKGDTVKPNRARTYLGGLTEENLINSLIVASTITVAEAFIADQKQLNIAGTNPLDRVSAQWNVSHTQVVANNSLLAGVIKASQVPATQRRRRIGVGI